MGGKTATTQQSVTIPPEVLARYNAVNARAEQVAQQPFQQYGGQFVAPLTGTQQAGIGATYQAAGAAQPYYGAAAGLTAAGAGSVTPGELETQRYMNPFTQNVVEATRRGLEQQQGMQLAEQQAAAIRGGAFGGDRAGIQRAVLQGQQGLATAQAISPLYQQAYQQAQQTAAQQQGVGLQAQQANLQRQLAAGAQFGQLGAGAQQAGLAGAQALLGAGTLEQQTQQADLTARYQQFLQERGYPFQVAQFLANIAMGTGALSGSTTTTTQPAPFFSDEREKTNIKPLGKGLYAYDYKDDVERARETGEPMPPKRVGPMAQDIEKKKPGLVVDINDYKVVNPSRDSMGGAVMEPGAYDRGGYAVGGLAPEDLRAIIQSQAQFLGPYAGQGGPYGGQKQGQPGFVPQASLPVPKLVTAGGIPQQRPSGLAEAAQTGSQIAGLAKMGSEAFGKGKEWLSSGKPDAETAGPRVINQSGAASAGLNAPRETADVAAGLGSAPVRVSDLYSEQPILAARGGLIPHGYAAGGSMNTAALPYQTEQDYFPEQILETQKIEPLKPAEAPKPQSSGLGEIIGLGAKILPFFLSTGGVVPRSGYQAGGSPGLDDLIVAEAEKRNMPPALLRALIQQESGGRPTAVGAAGELGVGQIKPSTARDPGYGVAPVDPRELTRSEVNVPFAADYLSKKAAHMGYTDLRDPENQRQALMLYNAGPQRERYASEVMARMPGLAGGAQPVESVPAAKPAGLGAGLGATKPIEATGLSPRYEGSRNPSRQGLSERPGVLSETAENAPFRTLFGKAFEGVSPDKRAALTSENLWIPALAGIGSMLASRSPYLGSAIGEGLVGGTKAYTDLQKQQAEVEAGKAGIEQRGAETIRTEQTTLLASLQNLPNGMAIIWTTQGPIPLGDYMKMKQSGRAPELIGRIPRNAEQVASERFPEAFKGQPGAAPATQKPAGTTGTEPGKKEAPPETGKTEPAPGTAAPTTGAGEKPSIITPSGVFFDDKSKSEAEQERTTILNGGAGAELLKTASKDYTDRVLPSGTAARDTSRFLTELAENLGNAAKGKGLNAPGFGFNARAEIINALNTFSRALGGPEFGAAEEIKQINEKISALQAAAATKSVGQESYAALALMKEAIANPKMSPRVFAKLAGDLLAQNQRMIDRYNHYETYAKTSEATAGRAQTDFERLHNSAKYNKEAEAISRMVLNAPDLIKDFRSGMYDAKEIDDLFKKRYGLEGMSRYFVGGR